jgi:hypothetical protein
MNLDGVSKHLLICNGKTCTKNGAEEVTETIRESGILVILSNQSLKECLQKKRLTTFQM